MHFLFPKGGSISSSTVDMVRPMYGHEELREDDDVAQVPGQGPQVVDGRARVEGEEGGQDQREDHQQWGDPTLLSDWDYGGVQAIELKI